MKTTHLFRLSFVFVLLLPLSVYAQTTQLIGNLADAKNKTPLIGATVMLTPQSDTTQKSYTLTDTDGKFVFSVTIGQKYTLTVNYIGYEVLKQEVSVASPNTLLETLLLTPTTTQLNEVKITAKRYEERAVQKGDTTEYNANAFKTNRDASAEELVSKMPGVTVENGTVKAQGEDVKKVLVDGKEFFGDDATLALRNLPAEVIDKIQVFDRMNEQSQFTGFDDGQSVKTLNIVTKADRRNGQFGKVYAGYGTDDRYQAGGNLNIFKGTNRLSILGMTNNINQQNFATQDLVGAFSGGNNARGGGNRGGGRGGQGGGNAGGNTNANFLIGQQSGIATTNSLGLNYSDTWGKKVTVNGSYFFNKSNTQNQELLSREYFLSPDSSQFYNANNLSGNTNWNHRVNFRVEYKIDSANSLVITPRLSFQTNRSLSNLLANTRLSDGNLLNRLTNDYTSDRDGYTIGNEILFRHRFRKAGRTFSFGVTTTWSRNDATNRLYSIADYLTDTTRSEITDQLTTSNTNSFTVSGNAVYTEPLSKNSQLQINYTSSWTQSHADKNTSDYDESTSTYSNLNTLLSNTFDNQNYINRLGAGYRYRNQKLNLMANVALQRADLLGDQRFPVENEVNKDFYNVLPSLMLNYKFTSNSNIRLFYRTSTNLPSISQLQNVINNTNPLLLTAGNPNLKQEYSHSFTTRFSLANPDKGRTTFVVLSATQTQNYIGNASLIAPRDTILPQGITLNQGAQLSYPVNMDGYWNARALVTYGMPVGLIKSNLNLTSGLTYARTPGMINQRSNLSNSYALSQGVVVSSNISEKIDFSLSYTANYTIVKNSLQPQLNNNFFYHLASGKLNWIFGKGFVLQNSLNYTQYQGLVGGFNQDYLLWNASFGKKFFKNQNGELKLSVFDLLNQNNNISRTITETYIEDSRTQVLQRYFMLTFTYTLRQFGK